MIVFFSKKWEKKKILNSIGGEIDKLLIEGIQIEPKATFSNLKLVTISNPLVT